MIVGSVNGASRRDIEAYFSSDEVAELDFQFFMCHSYESRAANAVPAIKNSIMTRFGYHVNQVAIDEFFAHPVLSRALIIAEDEILRLLDELYVTEKERANLRYILYNL